MLIRETTTPGASPSSTSKSTRANVIVNSYGENVMLAKLAYDPAICSGSRWMLSWRAGPIVEMIARGVLTGAWAERRRRRRIDRLHDHYIICGYGRVGRRVAEEFR